MERWASRDFKEKQLLQMTAIFFMAELNGDVVYESTKSPNNFWGPKTHASVKNRTTSERNEYSIQIYRSIFYGKVRLDISDGGYAGGVIGR